MWLKKGSMSTIIKSQRLIKALKVEERYTSKKTQSKQAIDVLNKHYLLVY